MKKRILEEGLPTAVTTDTSFGAHGEHTHSAIPAMITLQFHAHGHNTTTHNSMLAEPHELPETTLQYSI